MSLLTVAAVRYCFSSLRYVALKITYWNICYDQIASASVFHVNVNKRT